MTPGSGQVRWAVTVLIGLLDSSARMSILYLREISLKDNLQAIASRQMRLGNCSQAIAPGQLISS
jgi:hypothetical protein